MPPHSVSRYNVQPYSEFWSPLQRINHGQQPATWTPQNMPTLEPLRPETLVRRFQTLRKRGGSLMGEAFLCLQITKKVLNLSIQKTGTMYVQCIQIRRKRKAESHKTQWLWVCNLMTVQLQLFMHALT